MKVFFGMDLTEDRKNTNLDGECFVTHRITADQQRKLEENSEIIERVKSEADLPMILKIVRFIAAIGLIIGIRVIVEMLFEVPFAKLMLAAPWLIPATLACLAACILINMAARRRVKRMMDDDRVQKDIDNIDADGRAAYEMLGVPEDADEMDVLICRYKVKDGRNVIKNIGPITFANLGSRIFREDDALCIADVTMRMTIPMDCITGIRTVKKRVVLSAWNKETEYNKGEYKEYKIVMQEGYPVIREYHALCITREGVDYELYFPPYELPVIERLTGLHTYE